MLRHLNPHPRAVRNENGAVAIMVALVLTSLLIASAMVLDFGLVRVDRQMNKAAADSAVSAGLRGLDQGDGEPHPYAGICQTLTYLRLSQPELSTLPDVSNAAGGNVNCPGNAAQLSAKCDPDTTSLTYAATLGRLTVTIRSPYKLSDGGFAEESLDSLSSDVGDPALKGCDQLAVIISETKTPGLGSLATSSDLVSTIRSVGRVTLGKEGQGAVALLLLDRSECDALRAASTGTKILVQGNGDVPGLIHSDSIASTSCTGSAKLFSANDDYGIVAEEAVTGTPRLPGIIATRALSGAAGADPARAQDLFPKVVAKPDPGGATAGGLVTRAVVDNKYLSGVTTLRNTANGLLNSTTAPAGWTAHTNCSAGSAVTGKLWVDCNNFNPSTAVSFPNASELIFRGRVSGDINMPVATRVYIEGTSSPHGLSAGNFRMHHFGQSTCPATNVASRAALVIRQGQFTNANSSSNVQLCNTAVVLLGNTSTACMPSAPGQDYATNSCTGLLKLTGGTVRWTAPDAVGAGPRTQADFDAQEDLALWTEQSGQSHQLSGNLYLSGVFFLPNAKPFNITGGGTMEVANSQYIVQKLDVTGSGTLRMQPDPYDSITIPIIAGFGLVR